MQTTSHNLGHSSTQFAAEFGQMRDLVLKMGGLAEERVAAVVKSLDVRDAEAAQRVAGSDHQINALELRIDRECANILALRQPVARDLRTVITALKIITDLERIGDEAQKIAKQILEMGQTELPSSVQQELNRLGAHVYGMLQTALDGFARTRTDVLKELKIRDHEVDYECNEVVSALARAATSRSADIQSLLNALWCARALERIGDHAKNIGEYVVYLVDGKDIRHPVEEPPPRSAAADR